MNDDARQCRLLWQRVVFTAVCDALSTPRGNEGRRNQRQADAWIRDAGSDFQRACSLAGIDPSMLHHAYIEGRIDLDTLRATDERKRR